MRKSIRNKVIVVLAIIVMIIFTLLNTLVMSNFNKLFAEKEMDTLDNLLFRVDLLSQEKLNVALTGAQTVAQNTRIQELFANRDRDMLTQELLPIYEELKDSVSQIQFHLPDSTSFFRLHKPEKFGDSLKDFRFTVNEANESKETVLGLEDGVAGLGFRAVVPMFYKGKHIGSVEYGSEIGDEFVKTATWTSDTQYMIYQFTPEGINPLTETNEVYSETDKDLLDLKEGQVIKLISQDKKYSVGMAPIRDYKGTIIGFFKVTSDRSQVLKEINTFKNQLMWLVIISAQLIIWLTFLLLTKSLNPLKTLVSGINKIADGDLTQQIEIKTEDETKLLADAFNHTTESLKDIIKEIINTTTTVASTSEEVTATSQELASFSERNIGIVVDMNNSLNTQIERLEETKESMKHAEVTLIESASSIEEISGFSNLVNNKLTEGSIEAKGVLEALSALSKSTDNINNEIEDLKTDSRQIEGIVSTIQDISSQTNLLALNASIEAARAGEAGRGFAVVADEIRKLAEESKKSSSEIADIINNIHKSIESTIETASANSKEMGTSMETVENFIKIFQEIKDQIDNINIKIEETRRNSELVVRENELALDNFENANKSFASIAHNAGEVKNTSIEQSSSLNEISKAIESLTMIASDLLDKIKVFNI